MSKMSFKVVAVYQYSENYGAHDWDGEGECPSYWKFKGSHEELLFDGCTLEMIQEPDFIEWANELSAARGWRDNGSAADFISLDIVPSDTLDWMDAQDAEWAGDYEYLALFSNEPEYNIDWTEGDPNDRYEAIAEKLGFEV
jgi:hypothetical protein